MELVYTRFLSVCQWLFAFSAPCGCYLPLLMKINFFLKSMPPCCFYADILLVWVLWNTFLFKMASSRLACGGFDWNSIGFVVLWGIISTYRLSWLKEDYLAAALYHSDFIQNRHICWLMFVLLQLMDVCLWFGRLKHEASLETWWVDSSLISFNKYTGDGFNVIMSPELLPLFLLTSCQR